MTAYPKISVILPAKPGDSRAKPLAALRASGYPSDRLEILAVSGYHPSVQRNRAAREATGDVLYFLDNDAGPALPEPGRPDGTLLQLARYFASPAPPRPAHMAGGPSWTPPTDSPFQQAVGRMFGSRFGGGAVRARYASVGSKRRAGQHELILCNLMMDRRTFLDLGGFDERLYPNEENDLIVRFQKAGGEAWYAPEAGVWRSQRPTLRLFLRQVFTYGRGRAEQTRVRPSSLSPMAPAAAVFALYLGLLPVWAAGAWLVLGRIGLGAILLPGLAHALLSLATSVRIGIQSGSLGTALRAFPLFALNHAGYGIGFLAGLVGWARGRTPSASEPITIERIALESVPNPTLSA